VARKDLPANALYVVQGHDHPWLRADALVAEQAHWIAGCAPEGALGVSAKTRYRQTDADCSLRFNGETRFTLQFGQPQWAVTPGQSAVIYRGEVCLGGGVIESYGSESMA
jgi:tRNA-specific 2-thiouridylase